VPEFPVAQEVRSGSAWRVTTENEARREARSFMVPR
jgi:hypothetical protein